MKTLVILISNLDNISYTLPTLCNIAEDANRDVTVITNQQYKNIFEQLDLSIQVITIDTEGISNAIESKIISNDFALTKLFNDISIAVKTHWDECISIIPNKGSEYLSSLMKAKVKKGFSISTCNLPHYSNDWGLFLKLQNAHPLLSSIPKQSLINGTLDLKSTTTYPNFKISEDLYFSIKNKIEELKNNNRDSNIPKAVIGLFINPFTHSTETYYKVLKHLMEVDEYLPVIICLSDYKELDKANTLTRSLNKEITVLAIDLEQIKTLFMNLDLLITDAISIANICTYSKTKSLFIAHSERQLPLLSDITNPLSVIMSDNFNNDLLNIEIACSHLLYRTPISHDSKGLVQVDSDPLGKVITPLNSNTSQALRSKLARLLTLSILNTNVDKELFENLFKDVENNILKDIVSSEKEAVTNISRSLLNCLRLLKSENEKSFPSDTFAQELSILTNSAPSSLVANIPLRFLQLKMETYSLEHGSILNVFEDSLYSLKTQMKTLISIIDSISNKNMAKDLYAPKRSTANAT
jgi:hypothetical protein